MLSTASHIEQIHFSLSCINVHESTMNTKKGQMLILLVLTVFIVNEITILSAYKEVYSAKANVDKLYKTLSSKILTLKMRLNQTEEKIHRTSQELAILKQMRNLLQEITKHSPCEHEYLLLDFRHKQCISIEAEEEIPEDYTITLQVNHRAMVDENLVEKDGRDLRVFYLESEGSLPVEIDRLIDNVYTNTTTVQFRIQKTISSGTVDCQSYALVFGGKYNVKVKDGLNNVFALYETFRVQDLNDWSKVWGEWTVKNGMLFGKTGISTHGSGEVGIYFNRGKNWHDVEVELDLMETDSNVAFPGPFLRISEPNLKHTTAWWFEYYTDHQECTMRPFQDNKDGGWKYKCKLPEKMAKNKWYHFKYRVEGHKIKQWANRKLIQDAIVDTEWMISKGTVGLGCHTIYKDSPTGCRTYYDNIKVKLLLQKDPKVSLGKICNIGRADKHFELGGKENPTNSCKEIYLSISASKSKSPSSGTYWIKTDDNGNKNSQQTFCDMKKGGWTLVGKISGQAGNIYNSWLVRNINVASLRSPKLPTSSGHYGCLDSRRLAVKHSFEIMFSSGENALGVGSKWVRWQLPSGRDYSTWWNHATGYNTIKSSPTSAVTVTAWNGNKGTCYQNKYGIMPLQQHGGSYPYASVNNQGNTKVSDYCMAVGVLLKGSTAHGWSQNANGYDSPQNDSDWPNGLYNHQKPYLLVWLK